MRSSISPFPPASSARFSFSDQGFMLTSCRSLFQLLPFSLLQLLGFVTPKWRSLKCKVPCPSLLPLSSSLLHILRLNDWNFIPNSTCPTLSYWFPTPNLFHTLLSSSQFMETPFFQLLRPRVFQSSLTPLLHILLAVFPNCRQHPTTSYHLHYDIVSYSPWIILSGLPASFLPSMPVSFQ